eukprot:8540306-Ditylum_brightwellii.AAC.1
MSHHHHRSCYNIIQERRCILQSTKNECRDLLPVPRRLETCGSGTWEATTDSADPFFPPQMPTKDVMDDSPLKTITVELAQETTQKVA